MTRRGPSAAQLRAAPLPDDDTWWWRCHYCGLNTQGGLEALINHTETVHEGHIPSGTWLPNGPQE